MKTIASPAQGIFTAYQQGYIDLVGSRNVLSLLESQVLAFKALLSEIPYESEDYAYAPGKWTIKQLVGHLIDTERILCYRALCIARGEKASLPGFEEDEYVANASFNDRSLYDLGHEFGAVREATLLLFKYLNEAELDRVGTANNNPASARMLVFMIAGHHIHHERVLRERYVPELI
ncbi:MAG TPA: DinB family protein [Bacteroidia bacterium]|nr:DinB family protein [Bacteroidia bacterium]